MTNKKFIKIKGMHCASCANNISANLKKASGIKKANVNFASERAEIEFDEDKISINEIEKIIKDTGYEITSGYTDEESEKKEIEERLKNENKLKIKIILSTILTLPIFIRMFWMWQVPGLLVGVSITNWLQAVISMIVVFVFGWQFHTTAFKQLKKLQASMDTLISMGTIVAFSYSLWAMFAGGHIYFESAATITTFILIGKYMELKSKNRASRAMEKLMELGVKKARIIDENGKEQEINIDEVKIGDILLVKPGEKVPLDGIIIDGSSDIDESMLTGESLPIFKKEKDNVFGSTFNKSGVIKFKTTKKQNETMLAQIIKTVEEAQNFKAPIQKLADKISSIFVPTVILISLATFAGWYIFTGDLATSIINAVAVLIISCPCALGIATPIAIMVGTSVGAKNGILIKNGESFEKAKKINIIAFDKTGTLTQGKPKVEKMIINPFLNYPEIKIKKIALSLSKNSNHPISEAVTNYAQDEEIKLAELFNFKEILGLGIEATCKTHKTKLRLGNVNLLKNLKIETTWPNEIIENNKKLGGTIVFLTHGLEVIAGFIITDQLKKSAKKAIESVRQLGMAPMLISGDNETNTKMIAEKLNINKYIAEVLPQDKQKHILRLQNENKKIAFVGDGINDAPSLAQADLGIAMGSGADIAKETGDIIIMKNDPQKAIEAIKLSQKTFKIIKQNLFWAFFYNVIAIPLAISGMVNPMIGAVAMSFSDITVIGNSLRIYKK